MRDEIDRMKGEITELLKQKEEQSNGDVGTWGRWDEGEYGWVGKPGWTEDRAPPLAA